MAKQPPTSRATAAETTAPDAPATADGASTGNENHASRPSWRSSAFWQARSERLAARPDLIGRLWRIAVAALPSGAIVLSVLTFGNYVMGLVRDRMFARTFGAGAELDAYNAAFVLPELAFNVLIAGAIVAPFVPIFIGLKGEAEETAREFARTILTLAVVVMAAAAVLLFVFAPETTAIIAPGFRGEQRDVYVGLFRTMCTTPVIFAASWVLGEILVAERRFFTYALAPLMYNAGIVAGTFLLGGEGRLGIYGAAVGAVIGATLHLAIRLVGIWRTRFRPRPSLSLRVKGLGEFGRLLVPQMVSHPIEQITFLYFTALATTLGEGSVSSLSFARNFQSVAVSSVGAAFAIAAFPALSAATAAGDGRTYRRVLRTNLLTIAALTTAAAVALLFLGGIFIRLFLGGGAFDDADIARTTLILAVFTVSIPLESLTHLLTRAIYATHNTVIPTAASLAGFVATVLAAGSLSPSIGLSAIPASFAVGMAVKVVLLTAMLVPRMAAIGRPGATRDGPTPGGTGWATLGTRRAPRRRSQAAQAGLALAAIALVVGTAYAGSQALANATLAVDPAVTPWAREHPLSSLPTPMTAEVSPIPTPEFTSTPAASGTVRPGGSASASPAATATPTPKPTPSPGPFAMDLYQKGDFVGEKEDTWCVAAAMQTSMNIMDDGADTSYKRQEALMTLAHQIAPGRRGGADPEGWSEGLKQLGYGNYEIDAMDTREAAIARAAKQIRLTNRPAGLIVWKGWHSWVMSGFKATADPAYTDSFTVTAVYIEDVWYNRRSSLWSQSRGGYSRPPDSLVAVKDLPEDFLPFNQPGYASKNGKFLVVAPIP